jgi:pimeloyl-ACP methyl ester carboxylesterase
MWRWTKRLMLAVAAILVIGVGLLYRGDMAPETLRQKYANAESEFIRVDPGLAVHVRDEGPETAPVFVLVHGSNSSLHTWEPWVAALKDEYRIITIDMPGHGLTGPHPKDDYSDTAFTDVIDQVIRAKNISAFAIGGNSMGGWISWNYAVRFPEKMTGLLIMDASGAPDWQKTKRDLPIGFRLAMTPGLKDIATKLTPRIMIEKSIRQTVSVQENITPALIDRYWELLRYPGNRRATTLRFSQRGDDPDFAKLSSLTVPVLIMWGREDKLIPVSAAAQFEAILPNDRTIIYDRVGHIPMEEIPARSAADVRDWLGTLTAPAATK